MLGPPPPASKTREISESHVALRPLIALGALRALEAGASHGALRGLEAEVAQAGPRVMASRREEREQEVQSVRDLDAVPRV